MTNPSRISGEFDITGNGSTPEIAPLATGGFVAIWGAIPSGAIHGQRYDVDGNPVGNEFSFNAPNAGDPHIGTLADGGFVVTWKDTDASGSEVPAHAQILNADGTLRGGDILITDSALGEDLHGNSSGSEVTGLANGNFVVTWPDSGYEWGTDGREIVARIYDANGNPISNEFRVNQETAASQVQPSITALESGGFVVSWTSQADLGSGFHIPVGGWFVQGQVFSPVGVRVGSEFTTTVQGLNYNSSVASLEGGGFVVLWSEFVQPGGNLIFAQMYDASGVATGNQIEVAPLWQRPQTTDLEQIASVDGVPGGGFVVTWATTEGVSNEVDLATGIRIQLFDSSGAPEGSEGFLVNTNVPPNSGWERYPEITVLNNGQLVVVWQEDFFDISAQILEITSGSGNPGVNLVEYSSNGTFTSNHPFDYSFWDHVQDAPVVQNASTVWFLRDDNTFTILHGTNFAFDSSGIAISGRISSIQHTDGSNVLAEITGLDYSLVAFRQIEGQYGYNVGIDLLRGDDVVTLSDGGSRANSGIGDDIVAGGTGNDVIYGNIGNDELDGSNGNDIIYGGFDNDEINGQTGNDLIFGGGGDDVIDGGQGEDTAHYGDQFYYPGIHNRA